MTARHLLHDDDLAPAEQQQVLARAAALKADPYASAALDGPRTVALVFDKPTLRTQASFSAGVAELGGHAYVVDGALAGIGERESVADVARVLGRQAAAIVWRTPRQESLEEMAAYAGVPVVNALSDVAHPCQGLADLLTVRERYGQVAGRTVTFLGDGSCNVAHSWLLAGAVAGMHVRVAAPEEYAPDAAVLRRAEEVAARTGGSARWVADPQQAVAGADVLATDTWVSMGQEADTARREAVLGAYALTSAVVAAAGTDPLVLHCLPAHRGHEISAELLDGPGSRVWDQAENRRHAQKAVLEHLVAAGPTGPAPGTGER